MQTDSPRASSQAPSSWMAAAVNVGGSSQFVSASEASSGPTGGPPTTYAPPEWGYGLQSPLPPIPGGNDIDYSLLLGHGDGLPQDPPPPSPFFLPDRPVQVSQLQLQQHPHHQQPPPNFERRAQQGTSAPSSGILATMGSAVGAAVRAMSPRQEAVSPRSAALIEETRQLELRVQAAQSSSTSDEQRRRDEAYNAAVRHRDELRRQLQHLDQQINTAPAAVGGYAPPATAYDYGALSRREFNANFNPGPPDHHHHRHQCGLELPPHLQIHGIPTHPPAPGLFGSYANPRMPEPSFFGGGAPQWNPPPRHHAPHQPSPPAGVAITESKMLEIALKRMPTVLPQLVGTGSRVWVDWVDNVEVILRAASRLILVSWTHSMELARDAYSRFLKAPEHHKAFIVAAPSPDSDIEAALFLLVWAAIPADISRRLAAVKRRSTSETLYAAMRHAQPAGVGDLADLLKVIKSVKVGKSPAAALEILENFKMDLLRHRSIGGTPIEPFELVILIDRVVSLIPWSKTVDLTNTEMRRATRIDATPTAEGAMYWLDFMIGQVGQHLYAAVGDNARMSGACVPEVTVTTSAAANPLLPAAATVPPKPSNGGPPAAPPPAAPAAPKTRPIGSPPLDDQVEDKKARPRSPRGRRHKPGEVCVFFNKGRCTKGLKCDLLHLGRPASEFAGTNPAGTAPPAAPTTSGCVMIVDDTEDEKGRCDQEVVALASAPGLISDLATDVGSDLEDFDLDDDDDHEADDFDPLESHRYAQRWIPLPSALRADHPRRTTASSIKFSDDVEKIGYKNVTYLCQAFPPRRLVNVPITSCRLIALDSGTGVPVMGQGLLRANDTVHRADHRLALHTVGGRVSVDQEANVHIPGLPLPFFIKVLPDSPMALPLNTMSKAGYRVTFEDDLGLTSVQNPFGDELYLHFIHDVPFVLDVEGIGIVFAENVDPNGNIMLPLVVDEDECDHQADLFVYETARIEPNACAVNVSNLDPELHLIDLVTAKATVSPSESSSSASSSSSSSVSPPVVAVPELLPSSPPSSSPSSPSAQPPVAVAPELLPSSPPSSSPSSLSVPPPVVVVPTEDDDSERDAKRPSMPRLASRSVPYLRAEAKSELHCVSHRPYNSECEVCVMSFSRAPPAKSGGFDTKSDVEPTAFGDLLVCDFKVIAEEDWFSRAGEKVCLVVLDVATGFRAHFPLSSRSASSIVEAFSSFAGKCRPRRVHCDNADEFDAACKQLSWPQPTHPVPYDHARNGTAERAVLTMIEQVRAALLQSGLSHRWWSCAAEHSAFVLNQVMKNDIGQSPFSLRFPDAAPVVLVPFGALVRVRLPREQARVLLAPFAPVLQDAVFLSYENDDECKHRGMVVVALCEDLRANARTPTVHRVAMNNVIQCKPFSFPFRPPGPLRTQDAQRGATAKAEVPAELQPRTLDGEVQQVGVNWWPPKGSRRPGGIAPSLWQHASVKQKRDAVSQ